MIKTVHANKKEWVLNKGLADEKVEPFNHKNKKLSLWFKTNKAIPLKTKEERKIEYEQQKTKKFKKLNADYKDTNVSLTSSDAVGLLQVQSAFALGVESTKFVFENGTVMTLEKESFVEFATWFSIERNKLFE